MKKISLLLAVLLVFSLCLVACEIDDRIAISIGFYPDASAASDRAMFDEWKQQFENDYPEYKIVTDEAYTYDPSTISSKALTSSLPTIFQTYFTEMDMLVRNEYIRDVDSQIKNLGWLDKMDDNMREVMSIDGKCYGIPRDAYGLGLFINLKIFHDVGLIQKDANDDYILFDTNNKPLYPTSFDDIYAASQVIADAYDTDKYGMLVLSANKTGGWQLANMGWNFGSGALQIKLPNGSWQADLANDGMVAALEWIHKMRSENLVYPSASFNYNDWYQYIGNNSVAMAFCGSDAIAMPVNNYGFDINDIAFVPMPTGDGQSAYSLYGGTPYVFSASASDEQVKGAMLFLKYIGRSPETDDISLSAIRKGFQVAVQKGNPIIPTIKAWKNEDYKTQMDLFEAEYCNVNMTYYKDFFETFDSMRHSEEPHYCQQMYSLLDNAIQGVLSANYITANPRFLLQTANNTFQSQYLSKVS